MNVKGAQFQCYESHGCNKIKSVYIDGNNYNKIHSIYIKEQNKDTEYYLALAVADIIEISNINNSIVRIVFFNSSNNCDCVEYFDLNRLGFVIE